jgi:hypothetical protein
MPPLNESTTNWRMQKGNFNHHHHNHHRDHNHNHRLLDCLLACLPAVIPFCLIETFVAI